MFKNYSLVLCSFCILIFYVVTIHKSASQKSLIPTNTEIDSLDATPGILQLVERAKKNGSHKILIPKGTYHFHPLKAFEKYVTISNNDKGVKRIVFPIIDFHNLEIDGQGSNFIIHGAMVPFLIENSTNISLKNFSIDWKRPFHSEGTVVAVNKSEQTFDLKMSEEFPYAIRGNELIYLGENGYEQGLQQNIFFDPNTKGLVYDNTKYLMDPWMKRLDYEYSAKEISPGVVRILDTIAEALPEPGWVFVTKGDKMPSRTCPAIHALYSSDLYFDNINLYHAGSMGLIAEKSKNIFLKNFNITLRPGSKRMMSSAADATHFVGCQGSIRIENCLFENMHDDGVNIHGVYVLLHGLVDKNTLGIQLNHAQQWGFDFAAIGDSVTLVDRATMEGYAKLVVKEIKNINEEYSHLIFDRDISTIIKPNTSIENTTLCPDKVFIKGCTIRNNRARGILISSRGKIEILNNYFSNEMAGIFISGDANFWWESGPVNNVLIKNNKFYNCCISKLDQAPILIDPIILKPELSKTHFEKNIVIDSNIFETFDQPILKDKSTNGLKFTNNTIIQTKTFKPLYPASPAISVVYSTNVVIKNNQYKGDSAPVLHLDKASFEKGIMKNNKGFKVGK